MKIAVVILNWNGRKLLEKFLPSVVDYSAGAEIYVADNASTDSSINFLKTHYPQVKIIQNRENGGYAKGYNDALAQLDEDVFVLLNSDVEVTKDWLLAIRAHFKENSKIAIAQPKILDYKNKAYFEYAGAAGGYVDTFGYPFCRGRIFNHLEKDEGQYNDTREILWASGACLIIRRAVFQALDGLDESYFAHQEEIDICWRAFNKGYAIMYLPDSTVYHLGGATLNAMNPHKTFLNFRNSLFNLLKNVPGTKAYFIIFIRLCLDGLAGVKFLFEGKPKHTWAVVKSHFSFYAHCRKIYKKRPHQFTNKKYAALKSIVLAYYLFKKKKFSDLDG